MSTLSTQSASTPTPALRKAFGYQGDALNLPVPDVEASIPFYERIFGMRVVSQSEGPPRAAVLARDDVEMRIVENGADPCQDGCAFHVQGVDALCARFREAGGERVGDPKLETHDGGVVFRAFFVVAPDGLCFWFGEPQEAQATVQTAVDP
eukprot:Amastigsp_a5099_27.p2 type:complete len:151 gc:universal Amastigsp_a5099_27:43-495(+)